MSLNEADTRAQLIDPGIFARGWTQDLVRRETTAGAIEVIHGQPRQQRGRVDYTLRVQVHRDTQPVAVALIEAKAEDKPPDYGLEQAKAYAACARLNVPFVYSSNGHQFVEFDRTTCRTSEPRPLSEFPTPKDLRDRYERYVGFSLDEAIAKPLLTRYHGGESTRRYYQDAAIRAVIEKVARCQKHDEPKRALLSMATGAGKTFIAVNLLRRFADAGQLRRALFVCDRDELRKQAHGALHNAFGDDAAIVYRKPDGTNNAANARVHVATYQTLGVSDEDDSASFLLQHYPEDYFSHIIIDECHRSAWGKWSQVLTRNPSAVQVGLTATPRQFKTNVGTDEAQADIDITANNIAYFGDPVYEYDIAQAIEDGYLAGCEIEKNRIDLDQTGITKEEILARNPVDAFTGEPVTEERLDEMYRAAQYEDKVKLPDRVLAMCRDLFNGLLQTGGPEQKTIIFCASDQHADAVAAQMNNLYAEWCRQNDHRLAESYAFKCTAASGGQDFLPDFRGASRSHFIATTVDLLTTGVDVPAVRNVVFFKYVKSPISFYQMVGRGTRIHEPSGKLMFRVYDYTNATRLFGEHFIGKPKRRGGAGGGTGGPTEAPIVVQGFDVQVRDDGRYVFTSVNGEHKAVPVDEYIGLLTDKLIAEASDLEQFRQRWIDPSQRRNLLSQLPAGLSSALLVRDLEDMEAFDLFDVLGRFAYQIHPLTRVERTGRFLWSERDWLTSFPDGASSVIKALANQFALAGTEGLESREVFQTPQVIKAGGLDALRSAGQPADVLKQTKERLFAA